MPRLPACRRSLLSYALAIAAAVAAMPCTANEIAVVIGETGAAYVEVAEEIRNRLEPTAKVSLHDTAGGALPELGSARLAVAVGARAAAQLAGGPGSMPLLVTLMPREAFERVARGRRAGTRPISAIHLDQPVERQFDLIRLALPEAKRIGTLLGPASSPRYSTLAATAMERGFRLDARQVAQESDLAPALQALLPDVDLLLALPDSAVFNAGTIQMILLSTYRHQRPLIGFSASYTRAGAVLSLFSTPRQIGAQAADMLRAALASGRLPPPQYPREYQVAVNPHVAHSLGLRLESEQVLLQRLRALE